ncbi:MAG TPA: PAS domain-containing sensor histidine kinase [Gemmatimonadaceae bacterium]
MSPNRRLTEFLLADIVRISADAVICMDSDHRITLFNEGAERIFGWTAAEMIGQPLDRLLPERARGVHDHHIEGFRTAEDNARRMGERREISGVRKNGEEFPAEAAIAKVHMGDSVVYSVVLRDITQQMELQKRLQRAVIARDETVGMVAHDLRNPLSAIKMLSATLLETGAIVRPEVADNVSLIRSAAEQMDALIQDLLDVTRAEAGQLRVDMQPVETRDLLEHALTTMRPLLERADIALKTDVGAQFKVMADVPRIGQVVSNLLGNAIKFTPKGGTVTIRATRTKDGAQFSVSDTGAGIGAEVLPHVFDRYWQLPNASIRARGAGLGLPIARGIIQAHGGRMWAESELGKGSTFSFTLTLAT